MTSLSNRGKKANGKEKSIHRSVALMSHKTTEFVTLIWNIPRSFILLTNNFSKEKFGKLYIVWIDNTFHFWMAFSLTLLMRFYLCFITVVLKLVLLLMSSSSLPLIIPHPKKSNLFLYLPIFLSRQFLHHPEWDSVHLYQHKFWSWWRNRRHRLTGRWSGGVTHRKKEQTVGPVFIRKLCW